MRCKSKYKQVKIYIQRCCTLDCLLRGNIYIIELILDHQKPMNKWWALMVPIVTTRRDRMTGDQADFCTICKLDFLKQNYQTCIILVAEKKTTQFDISPVQRACGAVETMSRVIPVDFERCKKKTCTQDCSFPLVHLFHRIY